MRRPMLLAVAVTASTIFAAAQARAGNLLTDGSFESGNFFGWTINDSVPDESPQVVIATDQSSLYPTGAWGESIKSDPLTTGGPDAGGQYVAYFSTDYATETLSQSVTLGAGEYAIGFDAYVPANGYANRYDASFSGSLLGTTLADASIQSIADTYGVQTWRGFYGIVNVTTPGTYTADFTFHGEGIPAKDIAIDRVFVIPLSELRVPEPATLALLGVGATALGLVRRRRA